MQRQVEGLIGEAEVCCDVLLRWNCPDGQREDVCNIAARSRSESAKLSSLLSKRFAYPAIRGKRLAAMSWLCSVDERQQDDQVRVYWITEQ